MVFYFLIIATVYLSGWRGRRGQDFWATFWIEPGFLIAGLHYVFFDGGFDATYKQFVVGWVLPLTAACVAMYWGGRLLRHFAKPTF